MEAFIDSKNIQNFTTNCLYSDPWYRPDLTFGKFQRKSMTDKPIQAVKANSKSFCFRMTLPFNYIIL